MAKVKRNLRPLLRFLSFSGTPSQRELLGHVEALAEAFRLGGQTPLTPPSAELVPERHRRYLFDAHAMLIRDRFEFLVYRLLRDRLEAGDVFCPERRC